MMRRQMISVLMGALLAFTGASFTAGCNGGENSATPTQTVETDQNFSRELEILKDNRGYTPEERLAKIKAEYLLQNGGYSDGDEVVAILTLPRKSLSESWQAAGNSSYTDVAAYAASAEGKRVLSGLREEQYGLISKLYRDGLINGVEYTYGAALNGVAVNTTYAQFKKIEELAGGAILSANLSETYSHPMAAEGGSVTNAVDVYDTGIYKSDSVASRGITGKRTAVAVLDSGFDTSHTVFTSHPLKDDELLITYNDVEEAVAGRDESMLNAVKTSPAVTAENLYYSNKVPFAYDYADKDWDVFPYSSEHGTHVAGIIGGKDDRITGVAVDTQLVLMKVFPDLTDGAVTEDLLAALEDCILLGVDAINMSLGVSCGFAREEDNQLVNEVYDRVGQSGISLITAASNSFGSGYGGAQGNTSRVTNPDSGTVGTPSTYASALSVASISGKKSKYLLANGKDIIYFTESGNMAGKENDFVAELYNALGESSDKTITKEYYTVPGVGRSADFAALPQDALKGKIAVIKRGDTSFEEKAQRAQTAGAVACIIYNNVEGDISMSMGKSTTIPTVSVTKEAGAILAGRGEGTITIDPSNEAGPFMSDFSSWGPMPNLGLKPEITAHGGKILSSVPGGGYNELSGTSMATPNMCGMTVLVRQYLKDKFPQKSAVEICGLADELIMSTATVVRDPNGNPYSPRKQGAGLANLFNVVNSKAYLTAECGRPKIELGDDPQTKGTYTLEFDVVNMCDRPVSYTLNVTGMTESVSSTDSRFVAERSYVLQGGHTLEVSGDGSASGDVITVAGQGTLGIKLQYTLTQADRDYLEYSFPYGMYVEGFVTLKAQADANNLPQEGDIDLNIPFLGFYGDWTKAPMFDKTYYEVEKEAHDMSLDEEDRLTADYYATTPYGGYFNNYILPLGTYLYPIDSAAYDVIPASEEHIAISDAQGTIDGIMAVYTGLLRGAKRMEYTMTDKVTGEVIWSYTDRNVLKAFSQGGAPIASSEFLNLKFAEMDMVNNRTYTFTMEGYLDYGEDGGKYSNVRNTFSFDFTFDTEAPALRAATFQKEYDKSLKKDRYYINLTLYDNHYVQSVSPVVITDNGNNYSALTVNPVPVYGQRGQENTLRFEVTDLLKDSLYDGFIDGGLMFSIDDYALNTNIYVVRLPGTECQSLRFTQNGEYEAEPFPSVTLESGEVFDLVPFLATDCEDGTREYLKYLTWSSDNPSVAVATQGKVYALTERGGSATVTVRSILSNASATVEVIVRRKPPQKTSAVRTASAQDANLEDVRFIYFDTVNAYLAGGQTSEIGYLGTRIFVAKTGGGINFYPGEAIRLTYEVTPWYAADNYEYEFRSTNPSVAEVNQDGVVTAVKEGMARISLRLKDKQTGQYSGLQARFTVHVNSEFIIDNRTLVAYKGPGGNVVIPETEGITAIAPYAFCLYSIDDSIILTNDDIYANRIPDHNETVTSVVIPEGVTEIGRCAFYSCVALKSAQLPQSAKYVKEYAFNNCVSLTDINLNNVEVIGAGAFRFCDKLTSVNLAKCYSLGTAAFAESGLLTADISALRNAGEDVFRDCQSLTSVVMDTRGNTKLSRGMFAGSALKSVDVYSSTGVPAECFYGCTELKQINLYTTSSQIGASAFYGCTGLDTVTLPNCEIRPGDEIFGGCTGIKKVILQQKTSFTFLNRAFMGTAVEEFEVAPGGLYTVSADGRFLLDAAGEKIVLAATGKTYGDLTVDYPRIGQSAFAGADVTSLTFTHAGAEIEDYAFADCKKLASVKFTQGGAKIGAYAFTISYERTEDGDPVRSALIKAEGLENAMQIGDYAFAYTSVEDINLGDNVTVGRGAFMYSLLKTVTVGANATLGDGAFMNCLELVTVNMPQTDVKLGASCFLMDVNLADIDLSHLTEIPEAAFRNNQHLVDLNLAACTDIGDYAFAYSYRITSVNMPKVQSIGDSAFAGYIEICSQGDVENCIAPEMESVTLPATLKYLGNGAFLGCFKLRRADIPANLTAIGPYAFAYCIALTDVTLPAAVTEVGEFAFMECSALKNINLEHVTDIGDGAFAEAAMLGSAQLTSAQNIGNLAFSSATGLKTVSAPAATHIGNSAFEGSGLITIQAPLAEYVGDYAFSGCASLTGYAFCKDLKYLGTAAFSGCASLTAFTLADGSASGEMGGYALLNDDGTVYTRTQNGKWQLTSVPGGKQMETLYIMDGACRVAFFAGSSNPNIKKIVFPESVASIENFAFFGCTGLEEVEFTSVTAPVMENYWVNAELFNSELYPGDPGYGIVHGAYEFSNFYLTLCYYNFKSLMGTEEPLKMIVPANAALEGYDAITYKCYFGGLEKAVRSSYIATEKSLRDFAECARKLGQVEKITAAHAPLVEEAINNYNAITQNPADHGFTQEVWDGLVKTVMDAQAAIKQINKDNMSRTAREIQARIDALPESFDGSDEMREMFDALRREINLLTRTDRESLDLTAYNEFRASIEGYSPEESDPSNPGTDPDNPPSGGDPVLPGTEAGGCSGCGSTDLGGGLFMGGGLAVCLGLLLAVNSVLRKKRNKI